MENKKLQNGIDEIKKITMTSFEKERMIGNILNSSPKIEYPVRSIWITSSFISMIKKNHLVYYIIIPLIIVLSGGGIVFASEMSLPDSILYPVKVNIIEPIQGALIFSHRAKAQYESNLATKRLVEAEALFNKGKLNKDTENTLNNLLDNHTKSLNNSLNKLNEDDSNEDADEITNSFKSEMNAHARILDFLNKKEQDQEDSNVENANEENNSESSHESINKEGVENKEKNNSNTDSNQSFTEKTIKESSKGESSSGKKVIEDSNENLNESNQSIEKRDEPQKNEDVEYSD